jgi:hypothetical protein
VFDDRNLNDWGANETAGNTSDVQIAVLHIILIMVVDVE